MPQLRTQPHTWEILRSSIELIPLEVLDINGDPTTSYTVCCVPAHTQPVTFAAPTSAGTALGYLVNGPTLWLLGSKFLIYVKMTGSPETPIREAAVLYLR
jgi:hypothetical protein